MVGVGRKGRSGGWLVRGDGGNTSMKYKYVCGGGAEKIAMSTARVNGPEATLTF